MKGIILAGGKGTRLYPSTSILTKQLLPVYDKPMIYYPLTTLMLAGFDDILVITSYQESHLYQQLLRDGRQWGIKISYANQAEPKGIAEAFIIAEEFIADEKVALILGDNILYGQGLTQILVDAWNSSHAATVFSYYVNDPQRYGVVTFDQHNQAVKIEEKPENPESNYALIGLYFYDKRAVDIAKSLTPSHRGELEVTDISRAYMEMGELNVAQLGRGVAWLDTGTHRSLLEAANFIQVLEERQALKIGSPEEAAWHCGHITNEKLRQLAQPLTKSGYGQYLLDLLTKR